jgi:hypothetical protein
LRDGGITLSPASVNAVLRDYVLRANKERAEAGLLPGQSERRAQRQRREPALVEDC